MKFSVNSAVLLKSLNVLMGAVPNNPVVPILENFLFVVVGNKLTASSSNLQTTLINEIPVESEGDFSICVPAKFLVDTLKQLPDQGLTIVVDLETFSLEIIIESGLFKITGCNAIDFPMVEQPRGGDELLIPSELLGRAIDHTSFSVSKDDVRPALTGVLFHLSENNLTIVATDGHRLARYRRPDLASPIESDAKLIIPKTAINALRNALPSADTEVTFMYTPSNVFFRFDNTSLICRLIDEKYPQYEQVIPAANPYTLTINRTELLTVLRRVSLYAARQTRQIRFKISATEINIGAEDIDFSNEANESVMCEFNGEAMEIGFNAPFMIEMLSSIESNLVELQLEAPNRPCLIIPKQKRDNEDILMLVMPVMLSR